MLLGPLLLVALAFVVASFVFALSTIRPLDEKPLGARARDFAADWRSDDAKQARREERVREEFAQPRSVSIVQLLDEAAADGPAYVEVDEVVSDMGRILPVAQVAQISARLRSARASKAATPN